MKTKRKPVFSSHTMESPVFIVLSTFLLCGAIVGVFSGSYSTVFDGLNLQSTFDKKTSLMCIFDVFKYNLPVLFFMKYAGFLIPIIVFIRGYILSLCISIIYTNPIVFTQNSLFLTSVLINIVAIPCFLTISTICINTYYTKKTLSRKKSRLKSKFNSNIQTLFILLIFNILWNMFVNYIMF